MTLRYCADDLADFASSGSSDLIRDLGRWLHDEGGSELMNSVFDLALARHGYAALPRVNDIWAEYEGWA